MKRSILLLLAGASLASLALVAPACGSSNNTDTTPKPGTDSGTSTETGSMDMDSSSMGMDTTPPMDTSGLETGDDAGMCGKDPTLHKPKSGEGVYCPGLMVDGGTSGYCKVGEACCDTPLKSSPASSCVASGGTCPTTTPKASTRWECDSPVHCTDAAKAVCCGIGAPKVRTGCTYEEIFPVPPGGSVCAASCATDQFVVCEEAKDCPMGKTCTPIKVAGKQIGYCK